MYYVEKYRLEIVILVLQLIEPFGVLGIVLGSIFAFYSVAFKPKLDVLSLFLVLLPTIGLSASSSSEASELVAEGNSYLRHKLPFIATPYMLGPLAVSIQFSAALAVPIRLMRSGNDRNNLINKILWFITLVISLIGLAWAATSGVVSDGGLTVGVRIVLSIGAVLLTFNLTKVEFEQQLSIIIKISVVLFISGFLTGMWQFIAVCFPPILIFSRVNIFWKIIGWIALVIIFSFNFSFTIVLTALVSFAFLLLLRYNLLYLIKSRIVSVILFLFPIWFMLIVISGDLSLSSESGIFSARFITKLFEDRGILWIFTLELINSSNFFLVPAARDVIVYDYATIGESAWGIGAHNIYLESARHIGTFATIILTLIMGKFLLKNFISNILAGTSKPINIALFAVYLVWGLTGNALIYDGAGFMFWLIIGQIYNLSIQQNTSNQQNFLKSIPK